MEAPPAARPRQYYVSPAVPTKEAVALRFTVTTSEQVRREFQLSIQPANIDPKSGTTYGPIPLSENVLLPIDQRTNPALAAVRAEYRKMAQTELERINFKAKVSLE
jgi:hypothetical protein